MPIALDLAGWPMQVEGRQAGGLIGGFPEPDQYSDFPVSIASWDRGLRLAQEPVRFKGLWHLLFSPSLRQGAYRALLSASWRCTGDPSSHGVLPACGRRAGAHIAANQDHGHWKPRRDCDVRGEGRPEGQRGWPGLSQCRCLLLRRHPVAWEECLLARVGCAFLVLGWPRS